MTNNERQAEGPMQQAERLTTPAMLEGLIIRKERELIGLKALRDTLPRKLSPEADEALWDIICKARNR